MGIITDIYRSGLFTWLADLLDAACVHVPACHDHIAPRLLQKALHNLKPNARVPARHNVLLEVHGR